MLVALLGVFTFSVYFWYWLWTTSQETERFDERSLSPFDLSRWAVPTHAFGTVAIWIIAFQVADTASRLTQSGLEAYADTFLQMGLFAALFAVVALVGAFGMLFALRRTWKIIRRHENALNVPDPIRTGWLTFLVCLPAFLIIPFLNLLVLLALPFAGAYVLHRTQRGLNQIWEAAREGYQAEDAWPQARSPTPQQVQA